MLSLQRLSFRLGGIHTTLVNAEIVLLIDFVHTQITCKYTKEYCHYMILISLSSQLSNCPTFPFIRESKYVQYVRANWYGYALRT